MNRAAAPPPGTVLAPRRVLDAAAPAAARPGHGRAPVPAAAPVTAAGQPAGRR